MTSTDQKVLFTALGFLFIFLKKTPEHRRAIRAKGMANLIESFCRTTVPEAFGDNSIDNPTDNLAVQQRMASVIAKLMEVHGETIRYNLTEHGFTRDEVGPNWPVANAMAEIILDL